MVMVAVQLQEQRRDSWNPQLGPARAFDAPPDAAGGAGRARYKSVAAVLSRRLSHSLSQPAPGRRRAYSTPVSCRPSERAADVGPRDLSAIAEALTRTQLSATSSSASSPGGSQDSKLGQSANEDARV